MSNEAPKPDLFLSCQNFSQIVRQAPCAFDFVRFDPIDDCNLHCIYCHNARTRGTISMEDFRSFLNHNVVSIANFQMGCGMEPTLDSLLCDRMLMVADSPGRPEKTFSLQTNGILLNRHDYEKMKAAGLTHLSISIDTTDPETHKHLRGGSSLARILANIEAFRKALPEVNLVFVTTVSSANVGQMVSLVSLGLELGAKQFIMREIFYHPESVIVDHSRMPGLILKQDELGEMRELILSKFSGKADFLFADSGLLNRVTKKMADDSSLTDNSEKFEG